MFISHLLIALSPPLLYLEAGLSEHKDPRVSAVEERGRRVPAHSPLARISYVTSPPSGGWET